jgi:2-polyprenyl-3-methyl-5-hydroxy-6-metoxy-1,4-benzoquinol methylase
MSFWTVSQSREPELMDDPALAESEHLHALDALGLINVVSRTAAHSARAIVEVLAADGVPPAEPVTVVDVACGGGDVTIDLAARLSGGRQHGPVEVVGLDISPRAIERSRALAARLGSAATFIARDVLTDVWPPCDVAVSSLFLHHLDDASAIALLRGLAGAVRKGIVVSDRVRSPLGLALAVLGTTFLSTSRVARVDGPLSVRAARTAAEYRSLCDAAGLRGASIRQVWPARVVIAWAKGCPETRRDGMETAP